SSGSDLLDKAALKAAGECRYSPGQVDGKPVAVWIQFKTEFSLDDCEPDELLELSQMPEFLYQPPPVYPEKAKKDGIEGTVQMKVLVSKTGEPAKVKVVESSCGDCGFQEAAIAAARQYKFKPGLMDDKPVASWITFEVSFRLK
ncbi:MAG: TonB family protein, partial [candidate division Zixibacteria bacterium]|nr:TonB family protein [candidate division Zixibacteria bacterium]